MGSWIGSRFWLPWSWRRWERMQFFSSSQTLKILDRPIPPSYESWNVCISFRFLAWGFHVGNCLGRTKFLRFLCRLSSLILSFFQFFSPFENEKSPMVDNFVSLEFWATPHILFSKSYCFFLLICNDRFLFMFFQIFWKIIRLNAAMPLHFLFDVVFIYWGHLTLRWP